MKYVLYKANARLAHCRACGAFWADTEYRATTYMSEWEKEKGDYRVLCPICESFLWISRNKALSITREQYEEFTKNGIYLHPDCYQIV
jgi:hypothetical protein